MIQRITHYCAQPLQRILLGLILLFCLNNHSIAKVNGQGMWSAPGSSFIDTSATILDYDSGNYDFDGTSNNYNWSFLTHKQCPPNYTPFFVLIPDELYNQNAALMCYALEVTGHSSTIFNSTPVYSVSIFRTARTISAGGNSGAIAFSWKVYCYPPGVNPPNYFSVSSNC